MVGAGVGATVGAGVGAYVVGAGAAVGAGVGAGVGSVQVTLVRSDSWGASGMIPLLMPTSAGALRLAFL